MPSRKRILKATPWVPGLHAPMAIGTLLALSTALPAAIPALPPMDMETLASRRNGGPAFRRACRRARQTDTLTCHAISMSSTMRVYCRAHAYDPCRASSMECVSTHMSMHLHPCSSRAVPTSFGRCQIRCPQLHRQVRCPYLEGILLRPRTRHGLSGGILGHRMKQNGEPPYSSRQTASSNSLFVYVR